VRAFEPYQCTQLNGKWYLNEDLTKEWKPTDLHALTAKHAFPNIDETNPDWAHYRALGKRTNFAVNYGASAARIQEALKVDFTTAQALVNGYKQAFAGVVAFGKWINRRVYTSEYTPNLLLRKYYSRNKHQLQNWLVQGSGADILLVKLREVYNYIRNKPHWQFMISVHDEIGFTCKDIPETQLQQEVKEIKNLMTYELSAVDIIADVEYTKTNWADKEDWK
jgi:DNA polymerase I-like protein with 3'-5' exonuclease and polymerase domains